MDMAMNEGSDRLFVVVLLLAATIVFTIGFLTELSSRLDLGALGLALLAAALFFERATARSA
jgi:hypothetical protein